MFLNRLSFGSKECTIELKLASFGHLGHISDPLIVSKFHNETHDPKGQENTSLNKFFYLLNDKQHGRKMANIYILFQMGTCIKGLFWPLLEPNTEIAFHQFHLIGLLEK